MKYSHSRVECFNQCPYQYKLKYIDELTTIPNTDANNALYLGTAVHTGIEKTVEEAITQYYENYPVIDDLQVNEAIKLEYLIPKVKELLPHGEFEVKVETDSFIGFIDLLVPKGDGHYDLYDFKYSNNVDKYMESRQLHIYKYFYEMTHHGHVIDNLYFVFIPKTMIRQKKTEDSYQFRQRLQTILEQMEVTIAQVDYDPTKVMGYLGDTLRIQNATEYPKCQTRLCDWCQYQSYCEQGDTLMLIKNNKDKGDKPSKKKIWLFGAPLSGKTTIVDKFSKALILNTDSNTASLKNDYAEIKDEVVVNGRMVNRKEAWLVFKEAVEELEKKQNEYETIVVDVLDHVFEHCRSYMFKQLGIKHESDAGFGKGYDIVRKEFLDTIKRLLNTDYQNIILISHEDLSKSVTNRAGGSVTRIIPNIPEKVATTLAGMVGLIGRVHVQDGEYIMSIKSDESVFGGNRLGVKGLDIPLEYDKLMDVYNQAN